MNTNALLSPLHCLKYQTVSYLCKSMEKSLFYIPMITPSIPGSKDSKLTTKRTLELSSSLLQIQKEIEKSTSDLDLEIVKKYLHDQQLNYYMYSRAKGRKSFFANETREGYFDRALTYYVNLNQDSILFADPDIGSDLGLIKRRRNNPEKYLLKKEIELLSYNMKVSDILIFFQSFTTSIGPRLEKIAKELPFQICYFGFERYQGGIVIGGKDEATLTKFISKLEEYRVHLNAKFKESRPILITLN